MKLAALGVVTVALGVVLDASGLLAVGAVWVLLGFPVRLHQRRLAEAKAAADAAGSPLPVDGRTFAIGTLIFLGIGVPALVVGLLGLGFDADVRAWRWLPIVVGGLATGLAVVSSVLYLTGSVLGAGTKNGVGTIPATIWIRAMAETGTFVNERPRLSLELLVEPSSGPSYEVVKKATPPFTALGSLRVGEGFKALVAGAEDPAAMEIFWDEPVASPGSAASPAEPAPVADRLDELARLLREGKITDQEYRAQRERILDAI